MQPDPSAPREGAYPGSSDSPLLSSPLLSCALLSPVSPGRGGALQPRPRRAALRAAAPERRERWRRPAARPPSPLLEAPGASPAPPGFCSGGTGPRPISAPQGQPHNLPCCSARRLAPFGTGGARNPSKDTHTPQPLGLCLHLQIPDGYRQQGTGACPGRRRGHPSKLGHAGP